MTDFPEIVRQRALLPQPCFSSVDICPDDAKYDTSPAGLYGIISQYTGTKGELNGCRQYIIFRGFLNSMNCTGFQRILTMRNSKEK